MVVVEIHAPFRLSLMSQFINLPSFSESPESHKLIFRWVDVLIVGSISEHMCRTIYQPSGVEINAVAQLRCETPRHNKIFSPKVPWAESWQNEADEKDQWGVVTKIQVKNQYGVLFTRQSFLGCGVITFSGT